VIQECGWYCCGPNSSIGAANGRSLLQQFTTTIVYESSLRSRSRCRHISSSVVGDGVVGDGRMETREIATNKRIIRPSRSTNRW